MWMGLLAFSPQYQVWSEWDWLESWCCNLKSGEPPLRGCTAFSYSTPVWILQKKSIQGLLGQLPWWMELFWTVVLRYDHWFFCHWSKWLPQNYFPDFTWYHRNVLILWEKKKITEIFSHFGLSLSYWCTICVSNLQADSSLACLVYF